MSSSGTTTTASDLLVYGTGKNDSSLQTFPREKIDGIILKCSEGSDYFKRQKALDDKTNASIQSMKKRIDMAAKPAASHMRKIDSITGNYTTTRRSTSTAVVIDMDAFYFSCELTRGPQPRYVSYNNRSVLLSEIPCVVGHGMVLTSNYTARQYGVRSAMAGFIARKLVKELSNGKDYLYELTPDMKRYVECSNSVRKVLAEYDPNLRCYSLDECYMDLGRYVSLRNEGYDHCIIQEVWKEEANGVNYGEASETSDRTMMTGLPNPNAVKGNNANTNKNNSSAKATTASSPDDSDSDDVAEVDTDPRRGARHDEHDEPVVTVPEVVEEMRALVTSRTLLTCSAGIAPNHMLAKIASDLNKPNGQYYVPPGNTAVMDFLRDKATRKMGGIGRVTQKILSNFNIDTLGDLFEQRYKLNEIFKEKSASFLLRASLGWSDSDKTADGGDNESGGQKSLSAERTFRAVSSVEELLAKLRDIVGIVWSDLQKKSLKGKTATVKMKLADYDIFVRSLSQKRVFASEAEIFEAVKSVFIKTRGEEMEVRGGKFELRLLGVKISNFLGGDKPGSSDGSMDRFLTKQRKPEAAQEAGSSEEIDDDDDDEVDGVNPAADTEQSLSQNSFGGNDDKDWLLAKELQASFDAQEEARKKQMTKGADDDAEMALELQKSYDNNNIGSSPKASKDAAMAAELQRTFDKEDELFGKLEAPRSPQPHKKPAADKKRRKIADFFKP